MSYKLKYKGSKIDEILDRANAGGGIDEAIADKQDKLVAGANITITGNVISATGGGGPTEESDPVFTASPAAGITAEDIAEWNAKSKVSIIRRTTTGTNIADIIIDGTATKIYAPTGGSGPAEETDPVFTASPAAEITTDDITNWNSKTSVTESTVSGWGFTKNTGTYSKPSSGIPKTDLATAVQTSLGKADTALQSFTETDPTVPSWAKAASKPTYTASEVGARPSTWTPTASDVGAIATSELKTDASMGLHKMQLSSSESTPSNNGEIVWVYE